MPVLLPPAAAGFPLYGLVPGVLEPRWLELCDTRRPHADQVWRVALGHGDPAPGGPRVIVTTVPRLPAMHFGDAAFGPTAADDAIGWAQQSMLHAVAPDFRADSPDRQAWWRYQLELAGWLSGNLDAEDWVIRPILVNGEPRVFRLRQQGPAWAGFTETDAGWIAMDGINVWVRDLELRTVVVADYLAVAA
jgi:hypothetical protein